MRRPSFAVAFLFSAIAVHAAPAPLFSQDRTVTAPPPVSLASSLIARFKPYTYYAAAAYCDPDVLLNWSCGGNCEQSPNYTPYASGGDGNAIQNWFVGYDDTLKSIIVGHQGTNPTQFLSVLTDLTAFRTPLPEADFPNIPIDVEVHSGFLAEHQKTAPQVLAAVNASLAQFGADKVTFIGHSLGGALALLDATYFRVTMPPEVKIKIVTYGMPRVGNPAFANWIDQNIPDLAHINNQVDPIPIVPGRSLGYAHPSGEVHIKDDESWNFCGGQDNPSDGCEIGDTPSIIFSNILNHLGPYDGVMMGICWLNGKRELPLVEAAERRA